MLSFSNGFLIILSLRSVLSDPYIALCAFKSLKIKKCFRSCLMLFSMSESSI
jgi:hypothetical protein